MSVMVLAVVAIGLFVVIGSCVGIYNQLIAVRVNVDKSWANIQVLEKQRYDEIPKLVKVCEGYMQYERDTLAHVIAARTRYLQAKGPADVAQADSQLTGALKSLFALAESYPDLKANQNFMQMQNRVSALENDIADRREFYNESVTILNTRIEQFPHLVFARMLALKAREMYVVAEAERQSPEIQFQLPKSA